MERETERATGRDREKEKETQRNRESEREKDTERNRETEETMREVTIEIRDVAHMPADARVNYT